MALVCTHDGRPSSCLLYAPDGANVKLMWGESQNQSSPQRSTVASNRDPKFQQWITPRPGSATEFSTQCATVLSCIGTAVDVERDPSANGLTWGIRIELRYTDKQRISVLFRVFSVDFTGGTNQKGLRMPEDRAAGVWCSIIGWFESVPKTSPPTPSRLPSLMVTDRATLRQVPAWSRFQTSKPEVSLTI